MSYLYTYQNFIGEYCGVDEEGCKIDQDIFNYLQPITTAPLIPMAFPKVYNRAKTWSYKLKDGISPSPYCP